MQNLAGTTTYEANPFVRRELEAAGIAVAPVNPGRSEVQATLGGVIEVGGYEIRLERRWVYWGAEVHRMPAQPEDRRPHVPGPLAVALNDAPHIDRGTTKYSGASGRLGGVVRADGYAGGQASADIVEDGVEHWHIDTQDGLNAFAQWCRAELGP
jgi:hypothetical protein